MIQKTLKFWPVGVFLMGAYMGMAKLQWEVSNLQMVVAKLDDRVQNHHDRFVRWEGSREARERRGR